MVRTPAQLADPRPHRIVLEPGPEVGQRRDPQEGVDDLRIERLATSPAGQRDGRLAAAQLMEDFQEDGREDDARHQWDLRGPPLVRTMAVPLLEDKPQPLLDTNARAQAARHARAVSAVLRSPRP